MAQASYEQLHKIKDFYGLLDYLRDVLEWPIETFDFDEIFFEYEPEELGLDESVADGIESIRQLRSMEGEHTLGIFFVEFKKKKLPMVAMRRLLRALVIKKRASSQNADRVAFKMRDLLFISQYGEGDGRKISFAQFSDATPGNLPPLKVLAWGETQTKLTLQDVDEKLRRHLKWPDDPTDSEQWHGQMAAAFTLRHGHVIKTSKELATQLAELAKAIYEKAVEALEVETETGPLAKLLRAFQQALIEDLTPDRFADMYAQTITYGLFSAAVSSYAGDPKYNERRDVTTERMVQLVPNTNPFLREMLSTFLSAGGEGNSLNFDELGINDVVDLLNDDKTDIHSVIREFGATRRDEDPVIHFYEDFLKAYNSQLRFDRGVFYTPKPVVFYIVRSVHEMLHTEFGLEDGLADTTTWGQMFERHKEKGLEIPEGMKPEDAFVQILDPATGTATFLVEVIDVIYKTMTAKWKNAGKNDAQCCDSWNEYVPRHLLPRVYGYELMMAPYAIAHMKIGLKLTETGYRFGSNERARIFLTNTIGEPRDAQITIGDWFPALASEADTVLGVKENRRFTVVIGNPPYSGESQNPSTTEDGDDTFIGKLMRDYKTINGQRLDERNTKWLQDDYVKFIRYASYLLKQTDVGILGFVNPHGFKDAPTFRGMREKLLSTFDSIQILDLQGNLKRKVPGDEGSPINVFDIQQGVAICMFSRSGQGTSDSVTFGDLRGTREFKYSVLRSAHADYNWHSFSPFLPMLFFVPRSEDVSQEFLSGIGMDELFPVNSLGVVTARDELTIDIDEKEVVKRAKKFRDMETEVARQEFSLGKDVQDWRVANAQNDLSSLSSISATRIAYRPFDTRQTIFTGRSRGFHCRPRTEVMHHLKTGGRGLCVCRQTVSQNWSHVFAFEGIVDNCYVSNKSRERGYAMPLQLIPDETNVFDTSGPNLNEAFVDYLVKKYKTEICSGQVFNFVYAVLHSPSYRTRYAEPLTTYFPRIFAPNTRGLFDSLCDHGGRIAERHLLHFPVEPSQGVAGPDTNVEVESISFDKDTVWLDRAKSYGFRGIQIDEWEFVVGSYQPLQKWLKDRQAKGGKNPRPGRKLTKEDIEHYQKMVVAIRETIRLMGEIDEVIEQHGGWPGAFVTEPFDSDQTEGDAPFA